MMKKNIFLKLFALLLTLTTLSCSESGTDDVATKKETEEKESTTNNLFKATIDGTAYTDGIISGGAEDGIILLSGRVNNRQDLIQISVSENITTGTYDLSGNTVNITLILAGGVTNTFVSTAGSCIISLHNTNDKTISATFNADLKDALTGKIAKKITNAEFTEVSYDLLTNQHTEEK